MLRIVGGWCGRFRYVHRLVARESLVLTFLISQRSRVNSFQVTTCATHCAIRFTSSTTSQVAFAFALAPPIALDVSRCLQLAHMASWLDFSTQHICFDSALTPVAAGTYPIVSGTVNNHFAVPNALDTS